MFGGQFVPLLDERDLALNSIATARQPPRIAAFAIDTSIP